MNNLRLFDVVVIIKNYSIRILNLYVTGHAGSISNASDVFLTEGIYSEFWPRHSGCFNWMLGAFAKLRRATVSFVMSVRLSAWNNSASIGRIIMKIEICIFFETLLRKFKFHWNLTRITGTLHEDQYTFLIIYCSVLLRIKNVSDRICRENKRQILCSIIFKICTKAPQFYVILTWSGLFLIYAVKNLRGSW